MKTKYKILLIFIIILIIVLSLLAFYHFKTKEKDSIQKNNEVLDEINGFPYELKENDSKLKKELFYELEDVLKASEINYEKYAEVLAKLFIVDTFTLESKLNKYDIGGVEFVLEKEKEKFKNILSDTIYDSVENNYDGKRKQKLPLVDKIDVLEQNESKFIFDNKELLSYDIKLEWTYKEDLGYDKKALVKIIKENDLMYVISYSPVK